MKKLDKLLINLFTTYFLGILFVTVFILTCHLFLVFFNLMAGKGLGFAVYARLLFYISSTVLKNAFPLAILLASLIMFGTLRENSELVAIKAVGISLFRLFRPLCILVTALSITVFFLSGYITPRMQLKMQNLLYDIQNKKPSLLIKEGVFCNTIPGYSIKIGKKLADEEHLEDITIYDHTQGDGHTITTIAATGRLYTLAHSKGLVLELFNGYSYVDITNKGMGKEKKYPFYRAEFEQQKMNISLAALELSNTDPTSLSYGIATKLNSDLDQKIITSKNSIANQNQIYQKLVDKELLLYGTGIDGSPTTGKEPPMDIEQFQKYIEGYENGKVETDWPPITEKCLNKVTDSMHNLMIRQYKLMTHNKNKREKQVLIHNCKYEKYHRLSLAAMCFIMFLIGAPLGIIVKKGGLGIPFVFALFFIVIHYIIDALGKTWADNLLLSPLQGAWVANFVLLPFSLFFLSQAHQGTGIFELEYYRMLWKKIKGKGSILRGHRN